MKEICEYVYALVRRVKVTPEPERGFISLRKKKDVIEVLSSLKDILLPCGSRPVIEMKQRNS